MFKILAIALAIVLSGILLFPVLVAGTPYPCEAVARIVARKAPKNNLPEPWNRIADEIAIKVGTAYARNHGTLACYRLIPIVLKRDFTANQTFNGISGKIDN